MPEAVIFDLDGVVIDSEVVWNDVKRQVTDEQNVLNGIAYDSAAGVFYVTGKRWRTIFAGTFSAQK